jgi:hypothetical protein
LLSGGASQVPGGTTGTATHLLTKLTFKKTVSRDENFCLKAYTFISVISVGALIIFTFLKIMIWYDIYYETLYCFYELTQNSGKSFLFETLSILLKFPPHPGFRKAAQGTYLPVRQPFKAVFLISCGFLCVFSRLTAEAFKGSLEVT